ncbi:hypothetical protein LTSEMIS_1055, partial [Salmonella enterica subsp. enterica serovar Mississippi str. A4-633]
MLADQIDAAWRLNRVGGRVAENFSKQRARAFSLSDSF